MDIKNLRIFPLLAIARLGSSPDPMENFDLHSSDAASPRQIVPATSLYMDEIGNITEHINPAGVSFRDKDGLIRPIAPFFEVWIQRGDSDQWIPLTKDLLASCGLGPESVQWSLHVANNKIYRRTNDPNDRIDGIVGRFSDHSRHSVLGHCKNFLDGESVPLGSIQYAKPTDAHPEIRARFIPAHGKVYGAKTGERDPNITKPIYDPEKGTWAGYPELQSPNNDFAGRSLTNPNLIFAGYDIGDTKHVCYGYVDDECDGIVDVRLNVGGQTLTSFARVAAGPPTFAPDSKPVRSVADELEQALLGPDTAASDEEVLAVKDLVRRALETVRLMHTGQMNKDGETRGVGMARMDIKDVGRKSEPIFDPSIADPLAIRARHERVLLALESGSLAWFARVLRDYDKVGDLSDEERRKMPAMMRNADGRHLALTRRQVAKVRRVAQYIVSRGARPRALPDEAEIRPVNLAAQLQYRAKGNPPSTRPDTAISNAYPGLEMDFRNAWRRILDGIVLHESLNFVLDTERPDLAALKGMLLLTVDGVEITAPVTGPNKDGKQGPLPDAFGSDRMALEWSNALASVVHTQSGNEVECVFQSLDGKNRLTHSLKVRHFFEPGTAVIARDMAEPGALTQSLCAPWQNDYRECACFYWAANRPDFVNVEVGANGSSAGHNWMQKDRTSNTAKVYISDDWLDDRLLSHTDLIRNWEKALRFIIANQDEPPIR